MENILTGVSFMVIGMTVVFCFLYLLVIAVNVMKISVAQINKFFPEKEETVAAPKTNGKMDEIAAAIAAAYSMKK